MTELLAAWPALAWLSALPFGAAAHWAAQRLWQWFMKRSERFEEREDNAIALVDLLRRALDKGLIRQNGLASAVEILTVAIEHLDEPRPPMIETARRRALEHLRIAREACMQIDRAA